MQLLSPSTVKSKKKAQEEAALRRNLALAGEINRRNQALNSLPLKPDTERKAKEDFEAWMLKAESRKAELSAQLEIIETKRRIAEIPLEEREKELDERENSINNRTTALSVREASITAGEHQLKEAKESLAKEQRLSAQLDKNLLARADKISGKEDELLILSSNLDKQKKAFEEYQANKKAEIQSQTSKLEIEARRISILEQGLLEQAKELAKERIALKDQRETLQRAWDELTKKQSI